MKKADCLPAAGIIAVWSGWPGRGITSHRVTMWHGLLWLLGPRLAAIHRQLDWVQEGKDVDGRAAEAVWQTHCQAAELQEGKQLQGVDSCLRTERRHFSLSTLWCSRHSSQRRMCSVLLSLLRPCCVEWSWSVSIPGQLIQPHFSYNSQGGYVFHQFVCVYAGSLWMS